MSKTIFETLSVIDMGTKIKTLQGNAYIPWMEVKVELKKHYPEYEEIVGLNPDGLPYFDSPYGVFVNVAVVINGQVERENYPVLDGANKSMKAQPYKYMTKRGEKSVEACNSFWINAAIKRAFVKCAAGHGLGAYIFQDLPTPEEETISSAQLQEIVDLIKKKGKNIADVCQAWNVPRLAQLHEVNYDNFVLWLETN